MKTIEEKAEEYAYTNWESDEYHDGDEFDPIGHTQKAFEEGAEQVFSYENHGEPEQCKEAGKNRG